MNISGASATPGIKRMGVQIAKARREIAMLNRRDVLVLEEDDLVRQKRGTDRCDLAPIVGVSGRIWIVLFGMG
jgi:hypothetical protein